MPSQHHQSLPLEKVCTDLQQLHQAVAKNWGRIEIISPADSESGDDSGGCVLMSKAELVQLERALEIYHESKAGREMNEHIVNVAEQLHPNHRPGNSPANVPAMIDLPTDTLSARGDSANV